MLSREQQVAAYRGNVQTQEELDELIDAIGGEEAFAEQVQANIESYKNIKKQAEQEQKEGLQQERHFSRTSTRLVDSLFNRRKIPLDLSLIDKSEDDVLAVAAGRASMHRHLNRFNVQFE